MRALTTLSLILGSVVLAAACGSSEDSTFDAGANVNADAGPADPGPSFGDASSNPDDLFRGCATAQAEATRLPAYLLFVVDGSRSMAVNPDDTASPKWAAATAALDAVFDDFGRRQDPTVGVGLSVFCDEQDTTCKDDPSDSSKSFAGPYTRPDVPVAVVDAAQKAKLRARIDGTRPNHGTPTYEVLSGLLPAMETFTPTAPLREGGRKVVVFISDGIPDEDMPEGRRNPGDSDGEAKASKALVTAKASKVTTFSVGVGELSPLVSTIYDPRFMADLAVAGGAARPGCFAPEIADEGKMCHFQITPGKKTAEVLKSELERAIDTIRTSLLSCEYPLERNAGLGEVVDPTRVNVVYTPGGGSRTVLAPSATDGWSFDDPASPKLVRLNGATCDRVKADPQAKIDVVLGCKTLVR